MEGAGDKGREPGWDRVASPQGDSWALEKEGLELEVAEPQHTVKKLTHWRGRCHKNSSPDHAPDVSSHRWGSGDDETEGRPARGPGMLWMTTASLYPLPPNISVPCSDPVPVPPLPESLPTHPDRGPCFFLGFHSPSPSGQFLTNHTRPGISCSRSES